MKVDELTPESKQMNSLEEMSDEELAQAYVRISKAIGMVSNSLEMIEADYREKERSDNVNETVLKKAKENAEQAKEREKELDTMLDSIRSEVEERDIEPYELV